MPQKKNLGKVKEIKYFQLIRKLKIKKISKRERNYLRGFKDFLSKLASMKELVEIKHKIKVKI